MQRLLSWLAELMARAWVIRMVVIFWKLKKNIWIGELLCRFNDLSSHIITSIATVNINTFTYRDVTKKADDPRPLYIWTYLLIQKINSLNEIIQTFSNILRLALLFIGYRMTCNIIICFRSSTLPIVMLITFLTKGIIVAKLQSRLDKDTFYVPFAAYNLKRNNILLVSSAVSLLLSHPHYQHKKNDLITFPIRLHINIYIRFLRDKLSKVQEALEVLADISDVRQSKLSQ